MVGAEGVPYRYVSDDYAPPEGDDVAFTDPRLPDLTDPATLGCLLALVRDAHGNQCIHTSVDDEGWSVVQRDQPPNAWGQFLADGCNTEADALVAALEAAPCESSE
jgi:hypothetical protein